MKDVQYFFRKCKNCQMNMSSLGKHSLHGQKQNIREIERQKHLKYILVKPLQDLEYQKILVSDIGPSFVIGDFNQ